MFKASLHYSRRVIGASYGGRHHHYHRHAEMQRRLMTTTVVATTTSRREAADFLNNAYANNNMNVSAASIVKPQQPMIRANEDEEEMKASSQYNSSDDDAVVAVPARNKGIAEVIRAGWITLNQTALDLQNSSMTRKPLFTNNNMSGGILQGEEEEVSPRIKSEEYRILSVAKDCLNQIADSQHDEEIAVFSVRSGNHDSSASRPRRRGGVMHAAAGDDMIVLLHVEIKKGSREAILYWCLPYDLLLDEDISSRQKQFLEFRVQQQLEEQGNKMLQRRVHSVLRHYFPPKLRLEPATNDQLYSVLQELSDW